MNPDKFFFALFMSLVALAKLLLEKDNQTCGENWPAGQQWPDFVSTSKSIFMRRACEAAKFPHETYLKTLKDLGKRAVSGDELANKIYDRIERIWETGEVTEDDIQFVSQP